MADSLFIDRQSKLFQKFMQSRAHYSEPETPLTLKTQPPSLDLTSSKENDLDASNKAHQHRTQNDIQSAKHAEEKNTFCLTGASIETSKVVKTDSEKRWVNNSLNIEGGLGLDRILKRAIEKVRSSKVQELYEKKKVDRNNDDDSLQKLTASERHRQLPQKDSPSLNASKLTGKEAKKPKTFIQNDPLGQSGILKSMSDSRQEQRQEIAQLRAEISSLQLKLRDEKDKNNRLKAEVQKLKMEINEEIDFNEEVQKEKEDLLLQLKQLETFTSEKEKQVKKHSDDANYWRNQHEILNVTVASLRQSVVLLQKRLEAVAIENTTLKKERQDKEDSVLQLKIEMAKLCEQNKLAKQYLYDLTIKLYNYERQIATLKGGNPNEVKIESKYTPQQEPPCSQTISQQQVKVQEGNLVKRKRQFSRERSTTFQQQNCSKQTIHQDKHGAISIHSNGQAHRSHSTRVGKPQTDIGREAKIASIKGELHELEQAKIVNGRIRRRRIQLERELQQLMK